MKKATQTNTLPCTPDRFWEVFFDEAYLKAYYLETLGYQSFRIVEKTDTMRKVAVVPKINLPGPVAKLVGESFAYEEHGTLDRGRGQWTWRMVTPPGKKEIVKTHGTTRVVAEGASACKRIDEVVIESNVFMIGGVIESTAEKEARAAWAKDTPFLTRWLAEHPR
jgi:hypothetical protein